jgi:hypothetical protein
MPLALDDPGRRGAVPPPPGDVVTPLARGGYTGGSYAAGWALILGCLGGLLGLADTDGGQA